jgi:hypothetical protein
MLYLGTGLVCSDRRWRQENRLKRFVTVMAITAIYRLRRQEGAQIADILYRRYYSAAPANARHGFPMATELSPANQPPFG